MSSNENWLFLMPRKKIVHSHSDYIIMENVDYVQNVKFWKNIFGKQQKNYIFFQIKDNFFN